MKKETEQLIKKEVRDFLLKHYCQHQEYENLKEKDVYHDDYKEVATAYKNPTIKELQKIMDTAEELVNKLRRKI
jgi:hypothetical protein